MQHTKQVDSYRFLDRVTKKMVQSWIGLAEPRPIPWTPLPRQPEECTIALLSSAGLALKADRPFDQDGERQNPWWGDPSYRVLPQTAVAGDVSLYHLHVHPRLAEQDLNTFFPLQQLMELEARGEIGRVAPRHYSYMGYILQPEVLLTESIPAMLQQMNQDQVDIVLLVPV